MVGCKPSYDPEPLDRLRYGPSSETVEKNVAEAIDEALKVLNVTGQHRGEFHGVDSAVMNLWLAEQLRKAAEDLVYQRAKQARRAGVPKAGIAHAIGRAGGSTAVSQKWPNLDHDAFG